MKPLPRDLLILILFVVTSILLIRAKPNPPRARRADQARAVTPALPSTPPTGPRTAVPIERTRALTPSLRPVRSETAPRPESGRARRVEPVMVPFTVEDGVAVTMGDVVLGVPERPAAGFGTLGPLERARSPEVVFHIQPDLPNPGRVLAALRLFDGTPVHFTPYGDQEDVLVFQVGTGACKSYLGRVGGKQPIWLSPACGPVEIAHEIMHALGFIHEQNRDDRDAYIRVLNENVEPGNEINFARLPPEYLTLSGLGPFDYTSIMIYPKTMFGVGGRDTLESRRRDIDIEPARALSASDHARLVRAFGRAR